MFLTLLAKDWKKLKQNWTQPHPQLQPQNQHTHRQKKKKKDWGHVC